MMFKERLLDFNKRGLIHAPDESDDQFFLRCRRASPTESVPVSTLAQKLFDIEPDWVWVIYEKRGLRFWEGGCTWINGADVRLQLHEAFKKKAKYLGYSKEEIMAHELVHVVRSHFEEPIFEEILAYQTSSSPFRRTFAPLFRTSKESIVFITALAGFCLSTLFGSFEKFALGGLFCLIIAGGLRLFWTQLTFSRTRKKLAKVVGQEKALAVMIRMTDREIIRFSKMDSQEIVGYAQKLAKIQVRWQQIKGAYF